MGWPPLKLWGSGGGVGYSLRLLPLAPVAVLLASESLPSPHEPLSHSLSSFPLPLSPCSTWKLHGPLFVCVHVCACIYLYREIYMGAEEGVEEVECLSELRARTLPTLAVICPCHAGGKAAPGCTGSSPVCRSAFLEDRMDDEFLLPSSFTPSPPHLGRAGVWHFSLDECSQGDAILPCLVSGKERGSAGPPRRARPRRGRLPQAARVTVSRPPGAARGTRRAEPRARRTLQQRRGENG